MLILINFLIFLTRLLLALAIAALVMFISIALDGDQRGQQLRLGLAQRPVPMHTAIDFPAPLTYKKTEKLVQRVMRLRALMAKHAVYRKWQKRSTTSLEKYYPKNSYLKMIDSKKS